MAQRQFLMRRAATVLLIAIGGILLYVVLLTISARFSALPTAHHSDWVATLEGGRGGRTQLDLVYAAMRWYESPVLATSAAALIGVISAFAGVERSTLLAATIVWVVTVTAVSGRPSAPDFFAVLLSIVSALGGAALVRSTHRPSGLASGNESGHTPRV